MHSIGDVALLDYKKHKTKPCVMSSQIQPHSITKFNAFQF